MQIRHVASRAMSAAALTLTLALAAAASSNARASASLPALRADARQVSVSGLSSGAFMAVQYQVAYSASVIGAGVVAGGPYYCAKGKLANTKNCMQGMPDTEQLMTRARDFEASGQIDPLANLKHAKVYLFSGTKDAVVSQPVVDATWSFFWLAGVPAANLAYVVDVPAGHAFVTPAAGGVCSANATPFINHCTVSQAGYDQAGALLQAIYGPLSPPVAQPAGARSRSISVSSRPWRAGLRKAATHTCRARATRTPAARCTWCSTVACNRRTSCAT